MTSPASWRTALSTRRRQARCSSSAVRTCCPCARSIRTALRLADVARPLLPGPTRLLKLVAAPLALLPSPPLTPDAIDFINQPATVDIGPLLERMPRRLTRLEEGLSSYLTPESSPGVLTFVS